MILSELLAIIEVDTCRPIFDSNFLLMYMYTKSHAWERTWYTAHVLNEYMTCTLKRLKFFLKKSFNSQVKRCQNCVLYRLYRKQYGPEVWKYVQGDIGRRGIVYTATKSSRKRSNIQRLGRAEERTQRAINRKKTQKALTREHTQRAINDKYLFAISGT